MEFDIRKESKKETDAIRWSDIEVVKEYDNDVIYLYDEEAQLEYLINKENIDDLIKALKKAKELWA